MYMCVGAGGRGNVVRSRLVSNEEAGCFTSDEGSRPYPQYSPLAGHADAEARRSVLTALPCATLVITLAASRPTKGPALTPKQSS